LGVVLAGRFAGAVYLTAAFAGYNHHAVAEAGALAQIVVIAVFLPAIAAAGGHRMRAAVAGARLVTAAPLRARFRRLVTVRATVGRPLVALVVVMIGVACAPLVAHNVVVAVAYFLAAVAVAAAVLGAVSLLLAYLAVPASATVYLEMVYLAAAVALVPSLGRGADGPAALAFGGAWYGVSGATAASAVGACLAVVGAAAGFAWLSCRLRGRLRPKVWHRGGGSPVLAYYLRTAPLSAWAFVYVTAGIGAFVPSGGGAYRAILASGVAVAALTFIAFLVRYEALLRDRWNIAAFTAARGRLVLPVLLTHMGVAAVPYATHVAVRLL
jgi:hypothetical protein